MSEALERQAEQIKQQDEEIARQRREIDALIAGKQLQDQKQQDCSRAFRDYFDKAQGERETDRAVRLYQDGLALCPDDEVARYELAVILADRGDSREAEKQFEAALKINPNFAEARRRLDLLRKR
jgi:tetratricopeptide (TPR) repeat protein